MQPADPRTPIVSVVMPVYNGARTFERAIDSILSQTYRNLEVLICDNASSDETPLIVERKRTDSRVLYTRHSENVGAVANFLYGISISKGDYVLIAGDDDHWAPEYLQVVLSLINDSACIGIAQTAINRTDSSGSLVNVCDLKRHAAHLLSIDHCTLRAARLRLKHILFSNRCSDGYNPFNMLVLSLIDGPTIRRVAKHYPTDLVHDRAFMAAVVLKQGWAFTDKALMTKVSVHDRPYSERRAPATGKVEILTRDKNKYSNRKKLFLTLGFLMRMELSIQERRFVVLPQYFYFAAYVLRGFMQKIWPLPQSR